MLALPAPFPWKPDTAQSPGRKITVWDPSPTETLRWTPGRLTADASMAAYEWILAAIEACRSGAIDGIVTAPITKEGFASAGIDVPGHTELLAAKTTRRTPCWWAVQNTRRVPPVLLSSLARGSATLRGTLGKAA